METIQSKTPSPYLLLLAGIVLAGLTFLASLVGFLSIKQAPVSPPLIETE